MKRFAELVVAAAVLTTPLLPLSAQSLTEAQGAPP